MPTSLRCAVSHLSRVIIGGEGDTSSPALETNTVKPAKVPNVEGTWRLKPRRRQGVSVQIFKVFKIAVERGRMMCTDIIEAGGEGSRGVMALIPHPQTPSPVGAERGGFSLRRDVLGAEGGL
jgi:hypothetical protein